MGYETKTKVTSVSVKDFVAAVENDTRRTEADIVIRLMKNITGKQPKMWGPSIIGFGKYYYKYTSGHEGDICKVGFSPRKANLVFYILTGFTGQEALLKKLGKYKTGKGCLYINKLADIDIQVLGEIIRASWVWMNQKYG